MTVQAQIAPRTKTVSLALDQLFSSAPVVDDPSPYYYVTEVFDKESYQDILSNLPEDDLYGSMEGRTGNARALNSRLTLPLEPAKIGHLPSNLQGFWNDLAKAFLNPNFPAVALKPYQPYLQKYRPDLLEPGVRVRVQWELLRDFKSYGIGPHADHPSKILTMLFYLSDGPETEALGTSLYRPKEKGFTCDKGTHYDYDGFDRVTTVTYRPNTVFSFLRTNVGFHGVEVIEEPNITRNVMRYALWKL